MAGKKPKIRTILFTEVCPLKCTYCALKTSPNYGESCAFSKEKFFEEVRKADEDGVERILFTGGEPFAYWIWIKEVIEKYQNRFEYSFNTSGYYCTDDVLEFLSNYRCHFVLSVDGPRKIAQWRRPNNGNYNYDYWDKFLQNATAILYYFPDTAWKTILSKRMIQYIPDIFDTAHAMGFRSVDMVIDFKEESWRPQGGSPKDNWQEKDWEAFEKGMSYVSIKAMRDLDNGEWPTLTSHQLEYIRFIMNEAGKDFSIDLIKCGVGSERTTITMYDTPTKQRNKLCFGNLIPDKTNEEIYKMIEESYKDGCLHDKECPFFDFCSISNCLKDNYINTGNWFTSPESTCRKNRVECGQVLLLLSRCNEDMKDNRVYQRFLGNKV